jgi:hypothetical protein
MVLRTISPRMDTHAVGASLDLLPAFRKQVTCAMGMKTHEHERFHTRVEKRMWSWLKAVCLMEVTL